MRELQLKISWPLFFPDMVYFTEIRQNITFSIQHKKGSHTVWTRTASADEQLKQTVTTIVRLFSKLVLVNNGDITCNTNSQTLTKQLKTLTNKKYVLQNTIFAHGRVHRRFGHKYRPNCIFFIAHAQNGHISTSGQKSDVTIVFPDPDFLSNGRILAIREHLRQILRFSYLHGFSGPLGQKWRFLGVK